MLHAARKFTSNIYDLKQIYTTFVRSKLEHSAVVWHSSLTQKNTSDLERVQKAVVKIIKGSKYTNCDNGLKYLKLDSFEERKKLCLNFAKKCLKIEKSKTFFPSTKANLKILEILKNLKLIMQKQEDIKSQVLSTCKHFWI